MNSIYGLKTPLLGFSQTTLLRFPTTPLLDFSWTKLLNFSPPTTTQHHRPTTASKPGNISSKNPIDNPENRNQHAIPPTHALDHVRRAPEHPRRTPRDIPRAARPLEDGAPAADVRHDAEVAILEAGVAEVAAVEVLGEPGGLLVGDLRRRGVGRVLDGAAVAEGEDVAHEGAHLLVRGVGAGLGRLEDDAQAVVGDDAAGAAASADVPTGVLRVVAVGLEDGGTRRERAGGGQGFGDERVRHQAGGPHDHADALGFAVLDAEREARAPFLQVRPCAGVRVRRGRQARFEGFNAGLCLDGDALTGEVIGGVLT